MVNYHTFFVVQYHKMGGVGGGGEVYRVRGKYRIIHSMSLDLPIQHMYLVHVGLG